MTDDLITLRAAMLLIPQPQLDLIYRVYVQLVVQRVTFERFIEALARGHPVRY